MSTPRRMLYGLLVIGYLTPMQGFVSGDETSPTNLAPHPLNKALTLATDSYRRVKREIRDYTCVLVKRERVRGRLRDAEFIFAKIRHRKELGDAVPVPFAVYLKFLGPKAIKGREVLFVEGWNRGRLIARNGGQRLAFITMSLDPRGPTAMQGNRYPVTEIGILNLTQRLIYLARTQMELDGDIRDCLVKYYPGARIDERKANCIEVCYPNRREGLQFHLARIFVDDELQLPVRYEAHGWPESDGDDPPLLEEYTYTRIKLNVGLRESEFQPTTYSLRASDTLTN